MVGTPISVVPNNLMKEPTTKSKAMIKLRLVNGIRLDITIFFPRVLLLLVAWTGAILFLFILATISDTTIQMAADIARKTKGSGIESFFTVPM